MNMELFNLSEEEVLRRLEEVNQKIEYFRKLNVLKYRELLNMLPNRSGNNEKTSIDIKKFIMKNDKELDVLYEKKFELLILQQIEGIF